MDAEIKSKWTAALRSGQFKQAQNLLRDGDAYCCLGVLANIRGCTWDQENTPYLDGTPVADGNTFKLEESFAQITMTKQARLTEMNDSGASFAMIADYIDANL